MRDPITWSLPLGRLFGVSVRVHLVFLIFVLVEIMRAVFWSPPANHKDDPPTYGLWIDVCIVMGLLFLSVLAHEFGHCFGARYVNGDAREILMWPLGGLASVDVPHTPRAQFITTAAGPAVNLALCLACFLLLMVAHDTPIQPPWNPLPDAETHGFPWRMQRGEGEPPLTSLDAWNGQVVNVSPYSLPVFTARLFWINYVLFLLNVVLVGFPLDGGRMLQAICWSRVGYRQGTLIAIFAGFLVAIIVGIFGLWKQDVMALGLALFIYLSCRQQWVILETGGEDALFGHYDFSQGYTSLERDEEPTPRVRRLSWWQRWLQRRTARKLQKEQEQREADEQRMDQLLDKIQRQGKEALTDEERRFLKRVSDRYKNRH